MTEPFLAEIKIFAGNFAPLGYAFCQGQILPIAQNTALFSLLGTTYGGNGMTNFALPNLNGSVAIGAGQGPGLANYDLGQTGGSDTVALIQTTLPAHTHPLGCVNGPANQHDPSGHLPAIESSQVTYPYQTGSINTTLGVNAVGVAGGAQPHNNLQPYLALSYIIALAGIFPARS